MRAAIICPTSMLKWLQDEFDPHFHLVLAHVYLQDRKYAEFFLERKVAGDDIILDQGAAELGTAICGSSLMKVAVELKPTIVVAPDVIYNSLETVLRTGNFLKVHADKLKSLSIQIMAVPQGEDNHLYMDCFGLFNGAAKVDWLGVSKFYHDRFDGRANLLAEIKCRVKKPCHLLGVGSSLHALEDEGVYDFAKSTDTAKPIKLGLQGLRLGMEGRRQPMKGFFSLPAANLELVKQNIGEYLEVCNAA